MNDKRQSIFFSKGFTLIELIVVIMIVSVVALSITSFYADSVESYLQSETRLQQSGNIRTVLERIGRDIREAMPNSIRVNAAANCVEFVPIVGSTYFLNLPLTQPGNQIIALNDTQPSTATPLYVMVMPLNTGEIYNLASGFSAEVSNISTLAGNQMQIDLVAATRFLRASPRNRLYFVRQPVSYCVVADVLYRYSQYGFQLTQSNPPPGGVRTLNDVLLVDRGVPVTVFEYSAGNLNRNGLLSIDLHLAGRQESISLKHEVHVRNIP